MGFVPVVQGVPGVEDVLVRTSRRLSTTTTLVLAPPLERPERPESPERSASARARAALLVDPAWEPDELRAIGDEVRARGARLVAGFSTHAHHDHLLWHPRLGLDVPRWATPRAAAVARRYRRRLLDEARSDALRYGGAGHPPEVLDLLGLVRPLPTDAPGVPDPDGALPPTEVVAHDGHAPGHGAVWLPRSRVLLAGDVLSDVELPLPRDEITGGRGGTRDVEDLLAGLDKLAPYVARCAALVPGHGTPTSDAAARLDADRRYLEAVLAGRPAEDERLALPGMAEEDVRLRADVAR
ncbi:MBL fold metallo-hydrolase [Isoptericola sp. 4D.3]|uniref:MBL fold metallo-hydrolase n=1 Tax=Isoptericola peretonis TaxID=2918523 RepID=A0ABT0J2Y5_9MICO|nr:MBL fold metallo-hydrolase [Isoptericola sp. 4D.3]